MGATFELFEHTADLGVRVRAASLPELLAPATAGLYACIGTAVPVTPTAPAEPVLIELRDAEPAMLLHDFLSELLQLFDARQVMATALSDVVFAPPVLTARVAFAPVDRQRSELLREVKAVTYHALEVQCDAGGCTAQFIVDL